MKIYESYYQDMLKFEHLVINNLQLNTQRVWHTGEVNNIHLMCAPEGNSEFCFPESLDVSRDEVEGNIETRGKTKLTISRGSTH